MNNCIIIPIYKNILEYYEIESIHNTLEVMYKYDIYFVCPQNINKEYYDNNFIKKYNRNNIYFKEFDVKYFKNTTTYSLLCLSSFFYKEFLSYDYMLLVQPDAWIFYDNLEYFCNKGYDYIGALVSFGENKIKNTNFNKTYHIMNGGFSLRHNKHLYDACRKNKKRINDMFNLNDKLNEDGELCNLFYKELNIPLYEKIDLNTIFEFSGETRINEIYPELCDKLPFGCHGADNRYNLINIFNKHIKNNIIIYCIYHDESLIDLYNLNNLPNYMRLFNVNNNKLQNISQLSNCINELVAYYYIWKNNIKSDYVGFCHYKRLYKNLGFENLEKYGVHYYGLVNICINEYKKDSLFNKFDELYNYLCSTNKFNKDELYEYFYNDKIVHCPLKESFIFKWDKFVEACELIFGFFEYIYPNYKSLEFLETNKYNRVIGWGMEIYMGIIIALLNNNISISNTNWDIWEDICLVTYSDDKNKIYKWIAKNNKCLIDKYIICNNNNIIIDNTFEKQFGAIINDINEVCKKTIIELDVNQYIDCLDYNSFMKNEYEIKNIV